MTRQKNDLLPTLNMLMHRSRKFMRHRSPSVVATKEPVFRSHLAHRRSKNHQLSTLMRCLFLCTNISITLLMLEATTIVDTGPLRVCSVKGRKSHFSSTGTSYGVDFASGHLRLTI